MISKNEKIVEKSLLPESTLQSVGEEWGISRERVRQIFAKKTGIPYKKFRQLLLKNSEKFRCPICGDPINPRGKRTRYCSAQCYSVYTRYDLRTPRRCAYCNDIFFPFRNWRALSKRSKHLVGQFCCMQHYVLAGGWKGARLSKKSSFYKNMSTYKMPQEK